MPEQPKIQFTPAQAAAISARGGSLLVSAAAGSGKTRVLVERVVGLITDPVHPVDADQLLIMTFTNAAAAKLRADITARLAQEVRAHPGDLHLRSQQLLLQRASIGTVDAFCLHFVQQHFAMLDVPPDFETADEADLARIEQETLAATLETAVAPADATHVVISYTSSDNSVVTVSDTGEVEAVGAGEADITAAVQDTELSAVCKITVLPKIESVDLSDTTLSLKVGGTVQLTYTVQPEDAVVETATYTSSDESVATVDEEGTVTAVADGTATITVDVDGVTAECEVTVSTKAASAAGSNSGSSAASGSGQTEASAPADSSGFEYGAIPFSNANDGNWWFIDQADSPYWAVLNNINAMRAAGSLTALSASSSLDSIAYSRCDYQLKNNTLSHEGAQTPEILAQSQQSAAEVCSGWQNSPSHYAVIMNPNFTQIGICCFYTIDGKTIWCCTFG